jgi:hypothetical protein
MNEQAGGTHEQVSAADEVVTALKESGFDDWIHHNLDGILPTVRDEARESGVSAARRILEDFANGPVATEDEKALVSSVLNQLTQEGQDDVAVSLEGSLATEPETVEKTGESIDELTEQIKLYNGDRAELAALVRELGAANVDNPGMIDNTSSGSIRAEKAAKAVEEGYGMRVSMPEIQEAANRVYLAEEQAATPEQPHAPETVETTGESGAESSAEADDQEASPAGGAPSGGETVVFEAEPADPDEEPAAKAEDPETAAVGDEAAVEVDSGGGDGESAVGDGAAEAEPEAETLEDINRDELLEPALLLDQKRPGTINQTLSGIPENGRDQAERTIMEQAQNTFDQTNAPAVERLIAAQQLTELTDAGGQSEEAIPALQKEVVAELEEALAGFETNTNQLKIPHVVGQLREVAAAMPQTYATLREQLAGDPTFTTLQEDCVRQLTKQLSGDTVTYDAYTRKLVADYELLFGEPYPGPENAKEQFEQARNEAWQSRRDKIMSASGTKLANSLGTPPEGNIDDFLRENHRAIAADGELQAQLATAIDTMADRWFHSNGSPAVIAEQLKRKVRRLDSARQRLAQIQNGSE